MQLTKEVLKALQRKTAVMQVPDYDIEINIRAMSLAEQLEIEDKFKEDKNILISQIIMNCCIDESGSKLFDSVDEVKELPADLALLIFKECSKLNHLSEKDVEKLAKNS